MNRIRVIVWSRFAPPVLLLSKRRKSHQDPIRPFVTWVRCRNKARQKVSTEATRCPKRLWKCLQHYCNEEKVLLRACKIVASISKSTLAVTVLYQRHSSGIRSLIFSRRVRILSHGKQTSRSKATKINRNTPLINTPEFSLTSCLIVGNDGVTKTILPLPNTSFPIPRYLCSCNTECLETQIHFMSPFAG